MQRIKKIPIVEIALPISDVVYVEIVMWPRISSAFMFNIRPFFSFREMTNSKIISHIFSFYTRLIFLKLKSNEIKFELYSELMWQNNLSKVANLSPKLFS